MLVEILEPLVSQFLSLCSQGVECTLCCRCASCPFCYSLWPVEALWDQRDILLHIRMDKDILHICVCVREREKGIILSKYVC